MSKIRESLLANTQCIDEHTLLGRIRVDFERGDFVNLHGWLLSKTEARLCALFHSERWPNYNSLNRGKNVQAHQPSL